MSASRTRLIALCLVSVSAIVVLMPPSKPQPSPRNSDPDSSISIALAPSPRVAPVEPPLPVGAVTRFGDGRFQSAGQIHDLVFAASGAWLVGCGEYAEARIWNAHTGQLVRRFSGGDAAACVRVGITPDNCTLSVVVKYYEPINTDSWQWVISLRRYDVDTGREIARIPLTEVGKCWAIHAAFSPDGTALYAGTDDSPLVKYDLATGKAVWQFRPNPLNVLTAVAVAPDGRSVAVTSDSNEGGVRLLDASTGQMLTSLQGIDGGPGAVGFAADGRSLATGTNARNKGVTVWDLSPPTQRRVLTLHSSTAYTPTLSPDGNAIVVWGWFDRPPAPPPTTREELKQMAWQRHMPVSVDLHVFNPTTGAHRFTLGLHRWASDLYRDGVPPVVFSPDGAKIAVGGNELTLWDATTGSQLPRSPESWGGWSWRLYPGFSEDDRKLLFSHIEDANIVTRDMITGHEVKREPKTDASWGHIRVVEFQPVRSADGKVNANPWHSFGRRPVNPAIPILDAVTGREIAHVPIGNEKERAVAFNLDGKQLCTSDGYNLRVYDVATGKQIKDLGPGPLHPDTSGQGRIWCPHSPNGRYLAVWDTTTVTILDTSTWLSIRQVGIASEETFHWSGNERFTIRTREPSTLYLFSEDRKPRISEWDVITGCVGSRQITLPNRHYRTVSPNGRMLAAWGEQTERGGYPIILYEVESGRERHRFVCDEPCRTAFFSPGSRYLLGHHPGVPYVLWDIRGGHAGIVRPPDAVALERAWVDLASNDAPAAFRAIRLLANFPEQSIPLLRSKISPVAGPDPVAVGRLIAALGSDDFREREDAGEQLERLGWPVVSALHAAMASSPSPEVVRRATDHVRRIGNLIPVGPHLVPVRVVEVVEWAATPDAVKLLELWASGARGSRLTEESKGALARLGKK